MAANQTKVSHEQLREELQNGLSISEIAKKYGCDKRNLYRKRERLIATGFDPENNRFYKNPEDQPVKGYSTLNRLKLKDDESLGPMYEWVKTYNDKFYEQLIGAISDNTKPIPVKLLPKCKETNLEKDVIPWFNIGDGHFGMVAYDKEVGHNFDLEIAERELCFALGRSIEYHANCERCVIQDMGDLTHYETFSAQTEASKHNLDYDTRYPKMIRTYRRAMEYIVTKALAHFKYVDVIINQGNHSRSNDIWMAEHLRALFEKSKRVNVLNNECVFIPYRMGNTFVMSHHTDKCKGQKLIDVMSTDFRQDFGEAKYKYIDGGHIHTHKSYEQGDVRVETFNQLAPSDKYAHDAGWRSRSCLTTVLRSKTYGEVGRTTLTAEEVKDRIMGSKLGHHVQQRREVHTV